jgi:NAD(P)H dehydrogenase (quinone)
VTTVLVIGASGKTGRAVTTALLRRGVRVRAATRSPEQLRYAAELAPAVPDPTAPAQSPSSDPSVHRSESRRPSGPGDDGITRVEVVRVDLETGLGLEEAMAGVDALYHLAPNVHPDEVGIARRVADLAAAEGVSRLVFHSVLHPDDERMPHHVRKGEAEEVIRARLPAATVLRPAAYHQNLLGPALEGRLSVPYSLDVPFTNVDLDDVAQVAARVLTEDGHEGATYDLAGPESLTVQDLARIAGEVLRRPVAAERIPLQEWLTGPRAELDPDRRATLVAMFAAYDADGFVGTGAALTGLLGRAPATWRDVLDRQGHLHRGGD